MRWEQFEAEQPKLARVGRRCLGEPGVVLIATIRADGSPRVSAVEPLLWAGDLWLSMGWGSRKAFDLRRDSRILVHNVIKNREGSGGEYKVRGRAVAESGPSLQEEYAEMVQRLLGWTPEVGRFHLFRVDVQDVTFIRWDPATNDQFVARWPEVLEFVRRGTSATSLGDPHQFADLFDQRDRGD